MWRDSGMDTQSTPHRKGDRADSDLHITAAGTTVMSMDLEHRLTLPEEILLLGWDDERGRNRYNSNLGAILAGATMLELVLAGAVSIEDGKVRAAAEEIGEGAVDDSLRKVAERRRARSVKGWVHHWNGRRHVRDAVLNRLADRGIVRQESRRVMGLFPVERYPVVGTERVDRLRSAVGEILTESTTLTDERDAALGALVGVSGSRLIRRLVPQGLGRTAKKRAKALAKGDGVSKEVAQAIAEANAAVVAAVGAAVAATNS